MVVLSAEQVRSWDKFTMEREPIASIDLMERAARACISWMELANLVSQPVYIFCGKGNNGGDGLAIARMLNEKGLKVDVFITEFGNLGTKDFQVNLQRLHTLPVNIHFLQPGSSLPTIPDGVIIIEALLGTGINRPVEGFLAEIIDLINASAKPVISIDLPGGLIADNPTPSPSIKATLTLSFQCYKPALLWQENAPFIGKLVILDIGLHQDFLKTISPPYELMDASMAASIITPRNPFAHKGNFGHALLIAGSHNKMGAAIMAARACLRSGAGLLSCMVPEQGVNSIQTAVPEAMVQIGGQLILDGPLPPTNSYNVIGVGPGIGTHDFTGQLLDRLLNNFHGPMVWDADAINLLASNPEWLKLMSPFSILTPHPKEFERLVGKQSNDLARITKAMELAKTHQLIIVLKGHRSFIAMPGGRGWYNLSGNASMAKGGSGDILTGMITGLIARGYAPDQATLLGVYLHGLAGELASHDQGMESVLATDIIEKIGKAFITIGEEK